MCGVSPTKTLWHTTIIMHGARTQKICTHRPYHWHPTITVFRVIFGHCSQPYRQLAAVKQCEQVKHDGSTKLFPRSTISTLILSSHRCLSLQNGNKLRDRAVRTSTSHSSKSGRPSWLCRQQATSQKAVIFKSSSSPNYSPQQSVPKRIQCSLLKKDKPNFTSTVVHTKQQVKYFQAMHWATIVEKVSRTPRPHFTGFLLTLQTRKADSKYTLRQK
jgi:hypothetical protein